MRLASASGTSVVIAAPNVPSPFPGKTRRPKAPSETPLRLTPYAGSGLPSPLKSPAITGPNTRVPGLGNVTGSNAPAPLPRRRIGSAPESGSQIRSRRQSPSKSAMVTNPPGRVDGRDWGRGSKVAGSVAERQSKTRRGTCPKVP